MQGLGAGRSAATTRALEIEDRHRSPTIVVSGLCNVSSLIGGVIPLRGHGKANLGETQHHGEADSGMCVGVGVMHEINAARPTRANLLPSPPLSLSALDGLRPLAHNRTYWL